MNQRRPKKDMYIRSFHWLQIVWKLYDNFVELAPIALKLSNSTFELYEPLIGIAILITFLNYKLQIKQGSTSLIS